jgi:hypothetical protein
VSSHIIDEEYAKAIAITFVQQHHSVSKVEKPILESNGWLVEVFMSEPKERKFRVKINATTGLFLGFE